MGLTKKSVRHAESEEKQIVVTAHPGMAWSEDSSHTEPRDAVSDCATPPGKPQFSHGSLQLTDQEIPS